MHFYVKVINMRHSMSTDSKLNKNCSIVKSANVRFNASLKCKY